MKMSELLAFKHFYEEHSNLLISVKLAYKMAKIYRIASEEREFYSNQIRQLVEKIAVRNELNEIVFSENGDVKIPPESTEEFTKKIEELNNLTIDCNVTFSLDEFDEVKLTPSDLTSLLPFIQE